MQVSPFGHPRIKGYLLLPEAFRSLSRPSSALSAKASTLRPSCLTFYGRSFAIALAKSCSLHEFAINCLGGQLISGFFDNITFVMPRMSNISYLTFKRIRRIIVLYMRFSRYIF